MENENAKASEATIQSLPQTPDLMAPLSRELESVIAKRNLLTCRTRSKLLQDLRGAAEEEEVSLYVFINLIYDFQYFPLIDFSNCIIIYIHSHFRMIELSDLEKWQ